MEQPQRDIEALMEEGSAVDRAVDAAFLDAVRRHRQHRVPITVRRGGRIVDVDPFEIPLPEDQPADRSHGAD